MDAQKTMLFQLVDGNKQFRIPICQRAYSWRQEQCSRLLEDVQRILGLQSEERVKWVRLQNASVPVVNIGH